jgi:thiamine biosynthesis lipoprotein
VVRLANCGVSTAGDVFQRVEINGVRYSHIINPITCIGMTNHALATVVARNDMTADALDTTCTMLENREALELVNRYNASLRLVRLENGAPVVTQSRRFPVQNESLLRGASRASAR